MIREIFALTFQSEDLAAEVMSKYHGKASRNTLSIRIVLIFGRIAAKHASYPVWKRLWIAIKSTVPITVHNLIDPVAHWWIDA